MEPSRIGSWGLWNGRMGRQGVCAGIRKCSLALALGCALFSAGCIVIPVPTHDDVLLSGSQVGTNAIAEIVPHSTDAAAVSGKFGAPFAIWEDERIYFYWWDMRQAKVYWVIAGQYNAAAGVCDVPRHYTLLVQFDSSNRVQRIERLVRSASTSGAEQMERWARPQPKLARTAPKTIVLFRVVAKAGDKTVQEATRSSFGPRDVFGSHTLMAGVGTFETLGAPEARKPRKAEETSGMTGWYWYELPAGTCYFAVQGFSPRGRDPGSLTAGALLRLDISGRDPLIYGGTVTLDCHLNRGGLFSSDFIGYVGECQIVDESALAAEVAARFKPGIAMKTDLMKRHTGPYILRTPGCAAPAASGR